jgi:signal transduction histidine kinase
MTGLAVPADVIRARQASGSRAVVRIAWTLEALAVVLAALNLLVVAITNAGWNRAANSLVILAFATIGLFIATRHPRNPIGWIYCFVGLAGGFSLFAETYAEYGITHRPSPLPGTVVMGWLATWTPPLFLLPLVTLGFLLFPDGHLPSRRWRHLAWLATGAMVVLALCLAIAPAPLYGTLPSVMNPFGARFLPLKPILVTADLSFFLSLACTLASGGAMVVRLRRATGELRQQLKWMTYSACLVGFELVLSGLLSYFAEIDLGPLNVLSLLALPVTACVAIFRYRLYDIDVVISRTVVFGTLAVFITTVYVAVVVGLGTAIGAQGGPSLVLSILGAAIVAAVFQPVRARVERLAKRFVYGDRATPYEVLARFSERMAATYPSEELLPGMARLLAEGTGTAGAEVWLRFGDRLRRVAGWAGGGSRSERGVLPDAERPDAPRGRRTVLVRHHGEVLGALAVQTLPGNPLSPPEERLLADLAGQAGLVLRNVRLVEDLRASRERLVTAQDAERRRLERDIRERVEQRLEAVAATLSALPLVTEPDDERQVLTELQAETDGALSELRDLARGVYPPLLAVEGLAAALAAHARTAPLRVTVQADGLDRHAQDVEAAAYFCCLEALQNVAKHALAGRVVVTLSQRADRLQFSVDDDGVGFDPAATTRGSGLQNMADRAEALGGHVRANSTPGRGTTIAGWLPAPTPEPQP